MIENLIGPFDRCGLAAISDLETPEWKNLFAILERDSTSFLQYEHLFRSSEYAWPRDPLHNWSRIWEYPYVFHNLKRLLNENSDKGILKTADVGSGVTFFPFALARLGFHVICTDIDPVAEKDMTRAIHCVPHQPGKVDFRLIHGEMLPLADAEADAVYCISVLEHLSSFEKTISEIARVLRKGGLFLLTIDLDLRGNAEIGTRRHKTLMQYLSEFFTKACPEHTIHPADLLCSAATEFGYPLLHGMPQIRFALKNHVLKPLLGKKPVLPRPFDLAIQGLVLRKS